MIATRTSKPPSSNLPQRFYFLGVDTAPAQSAKADDGAVVILRAMTKARIFEADPNALPDRAEDYSVAAVYARKIRNASMRQWTGFIHLLEKRFWLSMIVVDPGGGGLFIRKGLKEGRQLIENVDTDVTPIVTPCDSDAPVVAKFNLRLFKRGDRGIETIWPGLPGDDVLVDAAHGALREAVDHGQIAMPVDAAEFKREQVAGWSEERQFALRNLTEAGNQLVNISVATKEDGTYAFTKRNARQFSARGKKDLAYSLMYAWVGFLIWLKADDRSEWDVSESSGSLSSW